MIATSQIMSTSDLGSILLMSRFETLLNDGSEESAPDNWSGHIFGAFHIFQSRSDEENYSTSLSYSLSELTIRNYNFFCLRKDLQRPPALRSAIEKLYHWRSEAEVSGLRRLSRKLHDLSDKFVERRRALLSTDQTSLQDAVSSCLAVDQELLKFSDDLKKVASFKIRSVSGLEKDQARIEVRPASDKVHEYKDHHEAHLWGSLRLFRLGLHNNLIIALERAESQGGKLEQEYATILAQSREVLRAMSEETCASAPLFLRSGVECPYAAASYLAWPLFLAGRSGGPDCHRFAIDALLWIGAELNIKSAELAAGGLLMDDYPDDWLLACYMF